MSQTPQRNRARVPYLNIVSPTPVSSQHLSNSNPGPQQITSQRSNSPVAMDFRNFGKFTHTPSASRRRGIAAAAAQFAPSPIAHLSPGIGDTEEQKGLTQELMTHLALVRLGDMASPKTPSSLRMQREVVELLMRIRAQNLDNPEAQHKRAMTAVLAKAVFSSNFIERVGLSLEETSEICRHVFDGKALSADDVGASGRGLLIAADELKGLSARQLRVRSRREVVQHAKAFSRMCKALVVCNEPLSEALIKETHRILTFRIDNYHYDGTCTPYTHYGGVYRTAPVSAGNTFFAVPKFVPKLMGEMVQRYQNEVLTAEAEGELRPFLLAARYSDAFVQIHPFEDGNGRMSRLIMNAVLIKYGGIAVALACTDEERDRYIGIMRRSGEQATNGEELAELVLERSVDALREFEMGTL